MIDDDGRMAPPDPRAFNLDEVPCTNYQQHAWVEAVGEDATQWLAQARPLAAAGQRLFFFHGIFTNARTRRSVGIDGAALPARLVNFRRHDDHGPSDVSYCAGACTDGVIALVPDDDVLRHLDAIEDAPRWYRREALALHDKQGRACELTVEFYLMNRGDVAAPDDG